MKFQHPLINAAKAWTKSVEENDRLIHQWESNSQHIMSHSQQSRQGHGSHLVLSVSPQYQHGLKKLKTIKSKFETELSSRNPNKTKLKRMGDSIQVWKNANRKELNLITPMLTAFENYTRLLHGYNEKQLELIRKIDDIMHKKEAKIHAKSRQSESDLKQLADFQKVRQFLKNPAIGIPQFNKLDREIAKELNVLIEARKLIQGNVNKAVNERIQLVHGGFGHQEQTQLDSDPVAKYLNDSIRAARTLDWLSQNAPLETGLNAGVAAKKTSKDVLGKVLGIGEKLSKGFTKLSIFSPVKVNLKPHTHAQTSTKRNKF